MNPIPYQAGILLDFIQSIEAPRGYDTIYANAKTAKPLTTMTVAEVLAAQSGWSKENGSSAAGAFQIMRDTLLGLHVLGTIKFDRELQRQLGYELLKRRGYQEFSNAEINLNEFAKRLAMEWASFPVLTACQGAHRKLKRGQSYYAGDGVNKALVSPAKIEAVLSKMQGKGPVTAAVTTATTAASEASTVTKACTAGAAVAGAGAAVVGSSTDAQTTLDQIAPVTSLVSTIGTYGVYVAGAVVGAIIVAFAFTALYKYAKS